MTKLIKILNNLHNQDYELAMNTGQCHLNKDQWKWIIDTIINEYKRETKEIDYNEKNN